MAESYIEINAFTHIAFRFFKIVGFVPFPKDAVVRTKSTWIIEKLKCLHSLLLMFCLATNLVFTLIYITLNTDDIKKVTNALPSIGYVVMVAIKRVSIMKKKKMFNNVLIKLTMMFPRSKEHQDVFQVQRHFKGFNSIQNIYGKSVIYAGAIFTIVPFFNYFITGVWMHKIPVEIWFPFDPYENLLYFNFVLVWHFIIYCCIISYLLGTDLICYAFITVIEMYFDNLKDDLMNLNDSMKQRGVTKLSELIERHKMLLSLCEDLETIFSPSILVNFITSSILICSISFQILFSTGTLDMFKFMGVCGTTTAQIMVMCHFGNKLIDSSSGVAEGAYKCNWYNSQDDELKSALKMIIIRAQRPSKLTAMQFSTVCCESFCKVSQILN
ncbi:unnamed protein product [Diamesa serratosioi]